jgi:PIN domain nuclease of toxin-antitoxin system
MPAVLDTHAAIWYLLDSRRLSAEVYALIDGSAAKGSPTFISAISLVEVAYLVERGRIVPECFELFMNQIHRDLPAFTVVSLDAVIAQTLRSIDGRAIPEMPDRIIAATAVSLGLPLVTRDARLQMVGIKTIW